MAREWKTRPTGRLKATDTLPERDGTPDSLSSDGDFDVRVFGDDAGGAVPWHVESSQEKLFARGEAATHEEARAAAIKAQRRIAQTEIARLTAVVARIDAELGGR